MLAKSGCIPLDKEKLGRHCLDHLVDDKILGFRTRSVLPPRTNLRPML